MAYYANHRFQSRRGRGRGRMRRNGYGRVPRPMKSYGRHMTPYRVKRLIDAELKRHTVSVDGSAPAVLGDIINISSLIVQGNSSQTRIGNWIRPVNYHGSLSVRGQDAMGEIVAVRAMILRWNEDLLHHVPTLDDIVENDTTPHGQFNFAGRNTFKVLWTRNFNIVNQDNNSHYQKLFKFYVRLSKGRKCLYDDDLPKKYQLFFMIFSDTVNVPEIPDYRLDSVLRYTDS